MESLSKDFFNLKQALNSSEARAAGIEDQLTAQGENLEAMHMQARKREQLISSLQDDLQQKGLPCLVCCSAVTWREEPIHLICWLY